MEEVSKNRTTEKLSAYKSKRNKATMELRRSKQEHERRIASNMNSNPKAFWKFINSKNKTLESIRQLTKPDGTSTANDIESAQTMNDYFCSVFSNPFIKGIPTLNKLTNNSLNQVTINCDTIKENIDKLKNDTSPGPDNISPLFLKKTKEEI